MSLITVGFLLALRKWLQAILNGFFFHITEVGYLHIGYFGIAFCEVSAPAIDAHYSQHHFIAGSVLPNTGKLSMVMPAAATEVFLIKSLLFMKRSFSRYIESCWVVNIKITYLLSIFTD